MDVIDCMGCNVKREKRETERDEILTPNIARKSGSLNLNGIFDTCNRFGWLLESEDKLDATADETVVGNVANEASAAAVEAGSRDVVDDVGVNDVDDATVVAAAAMDAVAAAILASKICCCCWTWACTWACTCAWTCAWTCACVWAACWVWFCADSVSLCCALDWVCCWKSRKPMRQLNSTDVNLVKTTYCWFFNWIRNAHANSGQWKW